MYLEYMIMQSVYVGYLLFGANSMYMSSKFLKGTRVLPFVKSVLLRSVYDVIIDCYRHVQQFVSYIMNTRNVWKVLEV